jgi:hypothetical protein
MNDLVRLTADWAIDADRVAVTYRVTNGGAEPVYVIDGSLRAGPGGVAVWSDRLHVGFRPPDTAVLGSRLVPLKPDVHSAFPPAAFAVRLAAGATHQSTLTAPLPLVSDGTTTDAVPATVAIAGKRVVRPFAGDPLPIADRAIVCRCAVFELGVIPDDETLYPLAVHIAGRHLVRLERPAWSLQRIVTAERRPIELPARVPGTVLARCG